MVNKAIEASENEIKDELFQVITSNREELVCSYVLKCPPSFIADVQDHNILLTISLACSFLFISQSKSQYGKYVLQKFDKVNKSLPRNSSDILK